jgi:hypothetical protein
MQDVDEATPTRYGILIAIMREYHWSWQDILNAPSDLIQEIGQRLSAEYHWRSAKQDFDSDMAKQRNGR